ncbi:50S ribosomal protein L7/L12 [Williamsoniiplasma lucivorax]|uniref:Large ribosomal subunit protein bL12 n=1 Tax=Williamsoniiplasma lucivorax TaxID=209274 RepID=A0A2S5REW1_9MOLU|nr:50S ribosomal protein L7/L12 [Williamsoniiplasma lucivorax]PPE05854.1 50S ribosomal protein L7/L12 [Williamsoniiplasma lucivorax]
MAITKDDIIKALEEMKLTELNDLVKAIEEHFGVVAAAAVAAPAAAATNAAPSEVSVVITAIGEQKVNLIKAVKELTGLGLMDAKKMVDGAVPITVKENVKTEDAEAMKEALVAAGATVTLK